MTVRQAADFCAVTPRAIQKQIQRGKDGPFPGAALVDAPRPYYRIPRSEVIAYKKQRGQSAQD